ncbi:hypothetical protein ACFFWC_29725 [Plantactinospora siamensis]|uniref:Uncharacterized protein n=1 Tax=Plantactinospora siamensis TaxID=555372 RepID=A0ABV6NR86_9ACTN
MFRIMMRRPTAPSLRAVAGAAMVLALAAACSDPAHPPTAAPTTAGVTNTAPTDSSNAPATPEASTPPSPTYTKPPSRNLHRPPGVAKLSGSVCAYGESAIQFFATSWAASQVQPVTEGRPVRDSVWAEAVEVLGTYHTGIAKTRSKLQAAGVPKSFVVYQDLADADAAIAEGIAAARAKDDSKVIPIYLKSRTAEDHIVESCSVLE